MKKKNFKKPLLVCLSALTLFSASATSIASSVIDNQSTVVHRVKRAAPAGTQVSGEFNVTADGLMGPASSSGAEFDVRALTYDQTPLGGNYRFAVVFAEISQSTYDMLNSGCIFPAISGNLGSYYTLSGNGKLAVVVVWNASMVDKDASLELTYDEREYSEEQFISMANELNGSAKIYGGYFGLSADAIINEKNVPGMFEDVSGPLISGSQKTYTTSVDNPISVETIKSALTAQDETDGDVTASIVIKSDNYTNNCHTLGSYNIVFAAYDKAGNESILTVTVVVQDVVDPVIEGPDTLTLSYADPKTLEDIKALYSVTDNYDTNLSIEVDAQSPNFDGSKVGTYALTLKAVDSSNHIVRKNITVNIVDDIKPVFSGASSFVTNNATSASLDDVMANCNIKAVDEISGNCEVRIKSETLTGNADKVGNYEVIYEATDAAGNTAEFKVTISITDGIPPVFYIDNTVIYAANDIMMTNVDLCNLMIATCEIDASKPYSLTITDTDGYLAACAEGDEIPVGEYDVTATVSYKDGNKDVYTKTISVYDSTSSDLEFEEVKLNFFEAIGQFFKNWKAAWDEGGFKLWWQKLWNGDLFKENMTKIVEVEKEVETQTSETSGK